MVGGRHNTKNYTKGFAALGRVRTAGTGEASEQLLIITWKLKMTTGINLDKTGGASPARL